MQKYATMPIRIALRLVAFLMSMVIFVLQTRNNSVRLAGRVILSSGASTDSPKKNVIAYSLYGNQEQFWGGAVPNANLAAELFPGWEVRYYHDDSVPKKVLDELRTMSNVKLYDMAKDPVGANPRTWRFHVALDPEIDGVYILRDTDSRLSEFVSVYSMMCVSAFAAVIIVGSGRWKGVAQFWQRPTSSFC